MPAGEFYSDRGIIEVVGIAEIIRRAVALCEADLFLDLLIASSCLNEAKRR